MKWKILGVIFVFLLGAIIYSFQPKIYPEFELSNNFEVDRKNNVIIFGATRNTGLEVAKIILNSGGAVTAVVRPTSDAENIRSVGASIVIGDALDKASVDKAFSSGNFTAVVSTIGCFSCDPKPDYLGNKNIFEAAQNAGVSRVILVSTIGAGDSYDTIPFLVQRTLKDVLPLKTKAENYLRESLLDYTIIRPGGLRSEEATMKGYLSKSIKAFGVINREDLAILIVKSIDDDNTIGHTLSAIDSELVFPWAYIF